MLYDKQFKLLTTTRDCIGIIDATYVPTWVPLKDRQCYRCKKELIAQNVMAVVGFDMLFNFVCADFEGSANDKKKLCLMFYKTGEYIICKFQKVYCSSILIIYINMFK